MKRGDVYWIDLGDPIGSEPGFRRPVLIVQDDKFNDSKLATTVVVSLTSNIGHKNLPGCFLLKPSETGLDRDSVALCTQIRTVDKARLDEHVGELDDSVMYLVDRNLNLTLGL